MQLYLTLQPPKTRSATNAPLMSMLACKVLRQVVMPIQALMAAEEEVRARAASRKAKYSGPMLRYHSKKQDDASVVSLKLP